jgi:hypothetical protein
MQNIPKKYVAYSGVGVLVLGIIVFVVPHFFGISYNRADADVESDKKNSESEKVQPKILDTVAYDAKMLSLANVPPPTPGTPEKIITNKDGTKTTIPAKPPVVTPSKWPVKAPYPIAGALLPFNRIVAYYGNFYSKGMGVLGQYPEDIMLQKLAAEVKKWNEADPSTPVVPAIDYIAVTAQLSPGAAKKYRLRMPDSQIDKAIAIADKIHGIVILEIQPALSTFQIEIPVLEKYLKMPQVHLALDPEFSMKSGARPGTEIGTVSSVDVNWAANYLANLVRANNLPPKILIVHRFTRPMVTGYQNITPLPEVQIVMDMDGWGSPAKKNGTYKNIVAHEPVQFTGFKLFYRNDLKAPSTRMLTTTDLLGLSPQPSFIQYQ